MARGAEWLLDNDYIIQRALRLVRKSLPNHYVRQLPLVEKNQQIRIREISDFAIYTGGIPIDIDWLKNALRIGRQGEIRDRTTEGQHYRMAGLNLLAAIIIYWNTDQLGKAVAQRNRAGLDCSSALLAHISPLGWAHILITGEYRWPKR